MNQTLLHTLLSRAVTSHGNGKQRKRETQAGRQRDGEERKNNHLKPSKPFNIHDRRDCGGSHKVWDIKPPKRL